MDWEIYNTLSRPKASVFSECKLYISSKRLTIKVNAVGKIMLIVKHRALKFGLLGCFLRLNKNIYIWYICKHAFTKRFSITCFLKTLISDFKIHIIKDRRLQLTIWWRHDFFNLARFCNIYLVMTP